MKSIQRGPTRDELDARVRELRLQAWRRRSLAAIVSAALAASTITPAVSLAEPGGWDGGAPSASSSGGGGISSPSDAADAAGPSSSAAASGETSGYGSSTSSSIGGSSSSTSSSGGGGIGSDHAASASTGSSGGGSSSASDAADAAGPSSSAPASGETSGYGSSTSSSIGGSSSSSGGGGIGSDHAASAGTSSPGVSSPTEAADAAPATSSEPQTGGLDPDSRDSVPDVAPSTSEPQTGGLDPDSRDSVPDVAPSTTTSSSDSDDASMPAVTAMGDATGYTQDQTTTETPTAPEPQTGGLDPDSRDSIPDVAPASTDTGSMPAVTAMGDATGYTQDQTTTTTEAADDTVSSPQEAVDAAPAKPATTTDTGSLPATTAMGDATGYTLDDVAQAETDTTPADPGSLPATTPMGDATGYTLDDVAQPEPAPATSAPLPIERPDGWQASVTATWGLGGTVGVAHDDEYTSITIGPAEGTGFFGSAGEGKAAHESTSGMSAKLGIGFLSGELGVDGTGITGKGNLNMPINPGINQTVVSYTGKINRDLSFSAYQTEGMSFGAQYGAATTQTVTIAIPNSAFETVANWLGLGPHKSGW